VSLCGRKHTVVSGKGMHAECVPRAILDAGEFFLIGKGRGKRVVQTRRGGGWLGVGDERDTQGDKDVGFAHQREVR